MNLNVDKLEDMVANPMTPAGRIFNKDEERNWVTYNSPNANARWKKQRRLMKGNAMGKAFIKEWKSFVDLNKTRATPTISEATPAPGNTTKMPPNVTPAPRRTIVAPSHQPVEPLNKTLNTTKASQKAPPELSGRLPGEKEELGRMLQEFLNDYEKYDNEQDRLAQQLDATSDSQRRQHLNRQIEYYEEKIQLASGNFRAFSYKCSRKNGDTPILMDSC